MKYVSKIIFVFFLAIIITYTLITPSLAIENEQLNITEKSENFKLWEELSENDKEQAIQPSYTEISLEDSIKKSKLNTLLSENNTLEAKYDLKELFRNNNIKTKNQKKTGSCWAFSYTSMIETMMAYKYGKSNI